MCLFSCQIEPKFYSKPTFIHFNKDIILLNSKLLLTNMRVSKFLSVSLHLSGQKIFPAILKSLSTGAEDAGIDK